MPRTLGIGVHESIVHCYVNGMKVAVICERFGISPTGMYYILKRCGVELRQKHAPTSGPRGTDGTRKYNQEYYVRVVKPKRKLGKKALRAIANRKYYYKVIQRRRIARKNQVPMFAPFRLK